MVILAVGSKGSELRHRERTARVRVCDAMVQSAEKRVLTTRSNDFKLSPEE
jgi:hypothetical protein